MRQSIRYIVAALMLMLFAGVTDSIAIEGRFGKSYALVIGIDQYDTPSWESLQYAVKDAQAIAAFLAEQGFEVKTLYDRQATRSNILGYLSEVLAPKLKAEDRVVVFFAGHGGTHFSAGRDHGFIVPADGGRGYGSNIQMDELRTAALVMDRARHILFIMDACYGGLLAATRGSKIQDNHPDYVKEITRRRARQVLTAGGADQQVADGGPGGHSQFTYHLLQALAESEADLNGDGYIVFAELAAYIVPVAFTFQQTPTYSTLAGHGLGEFTFVSYKQNIRRAPERPPTDVPRTRGARSTQDEALRFVEDFFRANNNEDVNTLLSMFSTKVDYFSWGPTRPHKIRKDKVNFFKRWPDVEYTPIGEPEIIEHSDNRFDVNIKFDFYVRSFERCQGKHGESSFSLGVEKILGSWKITSIKENVYYRDKSFNPC